MRASLREELKQDLLVAVGLLVAAAAYRMHPIRVVSGASPAWANKAKAALGEGFKSV